MDNKNRNREFDVVVFGASGFTGQYVVEELAISVEMDLLYKSNNIRWAIAGRNHEKLVNVLKEAAHTTKKEWCTNVPIIIADIDDPKSLIDMCKRCSVIISVVGPYRFYGEPLVKACIEAATNYVDISGEPQFLENMQLKYNDLAKQRGIYIVGASGWDSVPADMGLTYTKQQFKGDLNNADIIVQVDVPKENKEARINYGTWVSAIYGYAKAHELRDLRSKLSKSVPEISKPKEITIKHKPRMRTPLSYIDEVKAYCLPFPGSDKSVVRRSENYKYHVHKERPTLCETYFTVGSWAQGLSVIFVASIFGAMAKFSYGRSLLKRYPRFFSFGFVSPVGPPRKSLEAIKFSHTIIGYGWDQKLDDITSEHDSPPSKKIITRVSGPDPGYAATAMFVVHSAMTIIFDPHHLPSPGVHTPASCFGKSYLIQRLTNRNIKFEVVQRY